MVLAKKEHIKYEDACKEIETHITLNKQLLEDIDKAGKEIERLNNIINKIREWLEEDYKLTEICDYPRYYLDKFEEILDKVGDEK